MLELASIAKLSGLIGARLLYPSSYTRSKYKSFLIMSS